MKTLAQRRAAHAHKRVGEIENTFNRQDARRLYRTYVDRLGPAIVMNGLGQALATERATAGNGNDSKDAHTAIYDSLNSWLCSEDGVYPPDNDLLCAITEHDQSHYLRAQVEALAWLEWHKKFCRAAFPDSEGDTE